jgi:hypothetical protein
VLVSVKSGHVGRKEVGELRGTIEREKAALGLFITLEEPTRPMHERQKTLATLALKTWPTS